jgi:aspartyl-tRNA(Asn)/glutamyl-tRNA(Gln) amidotransferase subunit B
MAEREYEAVIGLEVHVQLKTRSKLLCADAAEFGAPPNTHVCPVCLGLPGALPTINARAVEQGVRAALALGCTVNPALAFARKHYFYPDLPKGYQVTQHDRPLAGSGSVEVPAEDGGDGVRTVRIRRVHLEEDTGRTLHDPGARVTRVDLNRAGIPLAEVVTEPDLASPAQARAFLVHLRRLLEYAGASDVAMEEGGLRVDANVSLRLAGAGEAGTRTELKNLSSFGGVEHALDWEIARQAGVLRAGGTVEPETLLWDAERGEGRPLRGKEDSAAYRYLPDPDLPPLELEPAWIERVRASLPEMPAERAARLVAEYELPPGQAAVLTSTRDLADYFEAVARGGAGPREAAAWVLGDVLAAVRAAGVPLSEFRVRPSDLVVLLELLRQGVVSRPGARRVFARMVETGAAPVQIVAEEGLARSEDEAEVGRWVDEALAAHPAEAERLRAGETRLADFFVGQVVRISGGRADPREAEAALRARTGG